MFQHLNQSHVMHYSTPLLKETCPQTPIMVMALPLNRRCWISFDKHMERKPSCFPGKKEISSWSIICWWLMGDPHTLAREKSSLACPVSFIAAMSAWTAWKEREDNHGSRTGNRISYLTRATTPLATLKSVARIFSLSHF